MKVAILGGGEIGQAIKHIIKDADSLSVFDRNPERGEADIQKCISGADHIFMCVPSRAIRDLVDEINKYSAEDALVIVLSKGMVDGKFLFEILDDELDREYGFL